MIDQVEDQLLAVAAADEVDFRALLLDERGVERGEDASEGELHAGIGGANLAREDLCVGIAGGGQEAEPDQSRTLAADLVEDYVVRRLGIRLVEHHAVVTGAFEHR